MSDGSPAAEVRFEAGAFGQLQSPARAANPVISGEFEFTLGGDTRVVRAGESLILPANVASGCFCLSAGVLLEIPQRVKPVFTAWLFAQQATRNALHLRHICPVLTYPPRRRGFYFVSHRLAFIMRNVYQLNGFSP